MNRFVHKLSIALALINTLYNEVACSILYYGQENPVADINDKDYKTRVEQSDKLAKKLEDCLAKQKDYSVVTLSRKHVDGDSNRLNTEHLNKLLGIVHKKSNQTKPLFVVMNEYMCYRGALEFDEAESLLQETVNFSKKHANAIYYINLFYKVPNGVINDFCVNHDDINCLQKYLETCSDLLKMYANDIKKENISAEDATVETDDTKMDWPIVSNSSSDIDKTRVITQQSKREYKRRNLQNEREQLTEQQLDSLKKRDLLANETFAVSNGFVVSRYRKSTYDTTSDNLLKQYAYFYGLGSNIKVGNSKLANTLHTKVYNGICLDLDKNIRLWNYRVANSDDDLIRSKYFATYEIKDPITQQILFSTDAFLGELRDILHRHECMHPSDYKLHIIQSDSIGLNYFIGKIPEDQVTIHSDSFASNVFYTKIGKRLDCYKRHKIHTMYDIVPLNVSNVMYSYKYSDNHVEKMFKNDKEDINFAYFFYNIGGK